MTRDELMILLRNMRESAQKAKEAVNSIVCEFDRQAAEIERLRVEIERITYSSANCPVYPIKPRAAREKREAANE